MSADLVPRRALACAEKSSTFRHTKHASSGVLVSDSHFRPFDVLYNNTSDQTILNLRPRSQEARLTLTNRELRETGGGRCLSTEQGWVKAEAGPPGIKQLHRRGRRRQRRSRCGRRGRQAPRPPPIGKGTADAGARAESAARALPSRHGRCRERPAGHVHGTASGRFVPRPTASATIAGWLCPRRPRPGAGLGSGRSECLAGSVSGEGAPPGRSAEPCPSVLRAQQQGQDILCRRAHRALTPRAILRRPTEDAFQTNVPKLTTQRFKIKNPTF